MNDLQARYSENDFWAPDGDRTRNLLMTNGRMLYKWRNFDVTLHYDQCEIMYIFEIT